MRLNTQTETIPASIEAVVTHATRQWASEGATARLWRKDATVWTGTDEGRWLGWLTVAEEERQRLEDLAAFAADVRRDGFTDVLLLGMGGSSLGPEVMRHVLGRLDGAPEFHVLDSTDPAQVVSVERRVDLARTLVIVASKSGSTLEPNIFKQYFFKRLEDMVGRGSVGRHFVAITDPGSQMQQVAERDGFRRVFFGLPSIGGRYSVLSRFGLVPAAAMGLDLPRWLDAAQAMAVACRNETVGANPAVRLGLLLGAAARNGRDKVTFLASPALVPLGAWLEQLIAESTGKAGKAIIPVDLERPAPADFYRPDRVFVSLVLDGERGSVSEGELAALAATGHPVIRIGVVDRHALAQEFFRWEMATAVAGAVMGINPFDQPDVETSKVATRALTGAYERDGALPEEAPVLEERGVRLFADPANGQALAATASSSTLAAYLKAHFTRVGDGDYVAILAYIEMNGPHTAALQDIRHLLLARTRAATCLGFGPRFLHSTGQAYKGGPNSGVFLQVTCDDAHDVPVPGQRYTFGVVKAAQAGGDLSVLAERGRRALRVHLGADVGAGLRTLAAAVREALS